MAKPCFACSHCSLDETVSQLHEEIAGLRQENLTLHAELQEIAELRNENLALKGELLTMYRQVNALYGFGQCAWPPPASNPSMQRTQKRMQHTTAKTASLWDNHNWRPKQRGKKKQSLPSEAIKNGPFSGASIDSLEEAAEAFVREFAFSDDLDIFRAVVVHTQCPDKDQQILIRAYMAKLLFPPGMTQFDHDNMLKTATRDLRSATDEICEDPDKARLVFSQFYNAFLKRSPHRLTAAAETAKHNVAHSMRKLTEGSVRELPATFGWSLPPVAEELVEEDADQAESFQSVS